MHFKYSLSQNIYNAHNQAIKQPLNFPKLLYIWELAAMVKNSRPEIS